MMRMRAALLSVSFTLTSPVFEEGRPIPAAYTCDGKNVSPPLEWTAPPTGTKSLALIMDDPDAPMGTWVHWVLYNLPPSVQRLTAATPSEAQWPDGTLQGTTSFGQVGYGGPCPPSGTHHYVFKLYALGIQLPLAPKASKSAVESAMQGHILAQARLIGTSRRR